MVRPLAFAGFLIAALFAGPADAAEIKVLSAGALRPLLQDLAPDFEKSSGNRLTFDFATAGGVEERIASGEAVDVALLTEPRVKKLAGEGKIAKDSIALIGRAKIGLAVKKGAPRPDIGSVEAFKRTLLAAGSVGYTDPATGGTSGIHIASASASPPSSSRNCGRLPAAPATRPRWAARSRSAWPRSDCSRSAR